MACDVIAVSGMAFEADIIRADGITTIYGLNSQRLCMQIEAAIAEGAKGIISFGTAAGLSPELSSGTILVASGVWIDGGQFPTDKAWSKAFSVKVPSAIIGTVAGVDKALASTDDKLRLYKQSQAIAADMESQHVARFAARSQLPFAVLRVVLDDANCALPPAALAAVTPEGKINYAGLLYSLIMQPQQIVNLIRLSTKQAEAKKALLRCSHLLQGSLLGMNLR